MLIIPIFSKGMLRVLNDSIRLKIKAYNRLAVDEGVKHIEIVRESNGFDSFNKKMAGASDHLHGDFIIQVDVVILLMNDIGVVKMM